MGAAEIVEPTLIAVAARCLRLPAESIDPQAPLVRYGLDSLTSLELSVAVSEATGVDLGEDVLLDAPSIRELVQHVIGRGTRGDGDAERLALMRADALLPADIAPAGTAAARDGPIVLTGANGFLGSHLLHELLRAGAHEIWCLVRGDDLEHARRRLEESMRRYRHAGLDQRVRVYAAEVGAPNFGLSGSGYAALAREAGAIVHCAAEVNWSASYTELRAVNVLATQAVLRFACEGAAKPVHFVSSVAAGYSTQACEDLTEAAPTDAGALHLGYGQSKWVAEQLVMAAHERRLPTTIYRPTLVVGHSESGAGNDADLFARMLRGSIALGCAPDLDWDIDACPVDFVAAAIAANVRLRAEAMPVIHLRNPKPAAWRAAVLWMNLRGYPVRLLPFRDWIERVRCEASTPQHPLGPLRAFLLARPPCAAGVYLPQLYARPHVRTLRSERSEALLAARGLECPRMSARLLERYFDSWIDAGSLAPSVRPQQRRRSRGAVDWNAPLQMLLRRHFGDPALRIERSLGHDFGSAHSIIGELGSWRAGSELALHARTVRLVRGDGRISTLELVLKPKFADGLVLDVTQEVAAHCDPALGTAFAAYREHSELSGAARREKLLYAEASGALQGHMPLYFGAIASPPGATLVLERVQAAGRNDALGVAPRGSEAAIAAALEGMARIHAQFLGREQWLCLRGVTRAYEHAASAGALRWWETTAAHAQPSLEDWLGTRAAEAHRALVVAYPSAAAAMAREPATLIHRDFNARNVLIRNTPIGPQLCAFDWELAAYGLAQRDVVEYLSFALSPEATKASICRYVELARLALERASGRDFYSAQWQRGVRLALADFGVTRLPLYFIVHRFRPQGFLQRVARTWWQLVSVLGAGA